ncbi:MAG: hypothetical protein KDE04_12440 [Anaerolineales bacterium]|nr:hypothetical protein [Anaerolineales bacterium]MCB0029923.1 hypothetical protein [Anaerolineales bacterium]MCB8962363.1 hypothetical protein [Ardenticatenales bacterium]
MNTIKYPTLENQRPGLWSLLQSATSRLWQNNWLLTSLTGYFALQFILFTILALVDDTVVTGANAWFKPMKFALSSAFYLGTITWMLGHLPTRRRLVNGLGYGLGIVLIVEVAVISFQAARGVSSHFNFSTPLNGTLFSVMGGAIMLLNIMTLVLAIVLAVVKIKDRPLAWAMRGGVLIALLAGIPGYMMTAPTADQRAVLEAGESSPIIGAHTVGAEDGGPGLPFLGWSTEAGDLRPAHFIGLHALQILPLAALVLRRRGTGRLSEKQQTGLIGVAGLSYGAFMFLLIWQASRGQALIRPDALTAGVAAAWLGLSTLGAVAVSRR